MATIPILVIIMILLMMVLNDDDDEDNEDHYCCCCCCCCYIPCTSLVYMKEGNVFFNDALNTFYLWLYGV